MSSNTNTVDGIITWFINLINNDLVPLVFALAFLLFLFGVFRFFFSTGSKAEENREQGKKFILWAVIAFAVMICIWGIVNLLVNTFPGFQGATRPCLPSFSGDGHCTQTVPGGAANSAPRAP